MRLVHDVVLPTEALERYGIVRNPPCERKVQMSNIEKAARITASLTIMGATALVLTGWTIMSHLVEDTAIEIEE
jgi:hypothetical protein